MSHAAIEIDRAWKPEGGNTLIVRRALWLDRLHADPSVTPMAFSVAYAIASHIGRRNGVAWPGQHTLAEECHCDRRTIRRCVNELANLGHLIVQKSRGRGHAITYRMGEEKGTPESSITHEKGDTHVPYSNGQKGTPVSRKGDTRVQEKGTRMSPQPKSLEPKRYEPSAKPGASRLGLGAARERAAALADATPRAVPPIPENANDLDIGHPDCHWPIDEDPHAT